MKTSKEYIEDAERRVNLDFAVDQNIARAAVLVEMARVVQMQERLDKDAEKPNGVRHFAIA